MSAGGQLGIVTSPHPLATEAGAKVLRAGGDAIEAAIAIGATIGVVYPHFCGLGGDSVWLVADREGRRAAFLGIGQAAKMLPAFDGAIPTRGPLSMLTTACTVDSWRHALEWSAREWGGHAPFPTLLADAIAHARDGFPVSRSQAFWLAFRRSEAVGWPGFAPAFMPDGPPEVGSLFRQDGVAQTLQAIAAAGPRSFYDGELAKTLAVRG
jgi:oxamate amidohydrolase